MRGVNNTVWVFSLTPATRNLAITKMCMHRIIGCTKPHVIKFFFFMGLSNLLFKPLWVCLPKYFLAASSGTYILNFFISFIRALLQIDYPQSYFPFLLPEKASPSLSFFFMLLPLLLTLGTGPKVGHNIQYRFCFVLSYHQTNVCRKLSKTNPMPFPWAATHSQEPVTVLCFAIGTVWYVSLFCPLLNAWHSSAPKVSSHFTHEITQYFQRSLPCSQEAFRTPMSFLYPPGTTYVLSYTKWWRG